MDTENVPVMQIIPCLANWKKMKVILPTLSKKHIILRKLKLSLKKKKTNDSGKLLPDSTEEGKEEKPAGKVDVFCQNLGITAYTLEN